MPYAQDPYMVSRDPVADDVGVSEGCLAQPRAGRRAAAKGKLSKLSPAADIARTTLSVACATTETEDRCARSKVLGAGSSIFLEIT